MVYFFMVPPPQVSSEIHIAYKELDDQIERLSEELLMVEERGRELEGIIRNSKFNNRIS